jgi:predicted DCC family thiol-disulfide oxidoreductase YuxK
MSSAPSPQLTLLYDGGCPLCLREVTFLRKRDQRLHPDAARLAFVDIDAADYSPNQHNGISYREAMGRIHAIQADGTVLRDVEVFRAAYRLIGLGWLYAPSAWPGLRQLADVAYGLWARWRLPLTRRPDLDQLCSCRSETPTHHP